MKIFVKTSIAITLSAFLLACSECNNNGQKNVNTSAPEKNSEKLKQIKEFANAGHFSPDWSSLANYTIPDWYKDAKFGIFIHWGVYSVPAFNGEWFPRKMYLADEEESTHHRKKYGPQTEFGYKDFIPMFKAEKFNADEWLKIVKISGAKYIVPVAEHHDGFSMYDNSYSKWDSDEMGPKRDVIAELKQASDKAGIHLGLSSHRAENWWFFAGGREIDIVSKNGSMLLNIGPKPDGTIPQKEIDMLAEIGEWLSFNLESAVGQVLRRRKKSLDQSMNCDKWLFPL